MIKFLNIFILLFAYFFLLPVTGSNRTWAAVSDISSDTAALFNPYWLSGTLDPARNIKWQIPEKYEDKLEYLPVTPRYVGYISEENHSQVYEPYNYFNIQPLYEPDGTLTVKPFKKGHDVVLFVDLGRTMPGTVELEANPQDGVVISFEMGEAMQPRHKYAADAQPDGSLKRFRPQIKHGGWTGLRYVWIRFENITTPFTLFRLNGIYQVRPSNYVGHFECSDDWLTRVWEMCAYSAHAVMGQPVGDDTIPNPALQTLCIDRIDRYPWAGDSRIIQTAAEYVFGEFELVRRANEQFVPVGKRPVPMLNGIPPYVLDWALAVIDYFRVSGDTAHFALRIADLLSVMDDFEPYLHPKEGWYFFDWDLRLPKPAFDKKPDLQQQAAFIGKYIQMCREAAAAAELEGDKAAAVQFARKAEECTRRWRNEHPDWLEQLDIHALTNLVLGNVLSADDFQAIYDKVYAHRAERCTQTPYFSIYVVRALAQMGRWDKAIEMIRDYWGTMIQAGATSTWEEWHPAWQLPVGALPPQYEPPIAWSGLSLIQPAGAGPAQWLLSEIVGIQPEKPGFSVVRIEPHTAGLKWAKGTAATPFGAVSSAWEITSSGTLEIEWQVPKNCQSVLLVVPQAKKYRIDNKKAIPYSVKDGKAYFTVPAGKHIASITNP